ncbi:diguanylate cyclase (GGDEF)-like protein [Leucobacter luti]|uniref:putative bifunctional diguanylate cyclase/phosphodiesterase n=1 Tax=Leucobacter luti TaxID=340320 RepID=UPI00104AB5DB|nr:bifunctional diguanylate cyclase/phosphodiesterase [Leucobacter luti]MCW2288091.1 diguanylate cyclase (GGDEF)-like protein [Leucobacter luti]TCK45747.1 diguanylate cyclase (GGDEF)-like protein [Leucobacter luti]
MLPRIDAKKQDAAYAAPFAALAVGAVAYGAYALISSPPESWTLMLAVILGVIVCGQFQVHIGRLTGFPRVGVSVTMLAVQPLLEAPIVSVCVWAIGMLVSQAIVRRNPLHTFYVTGLGVVSAAGFIGAYLGLAALGAWLPVVILGATTAYYTVFLLGEFLRHRASAALDGIRGISVIDFPKLGLIVTFVSALSILMRYFDMVAIPWLEHSADVRRTPFVVLLAALLLYVVAQRIRSREVEHRLSAIVEAAVELPRETGPALAAALCSRSREIVEAARVEVRDTPPARQEIGARVQLTPESEQFLVATHKVGGSSFSREDERALATLAHVASEAFRIQCEVVALERRANTDPLTGLPNYGAFQSALVTANEHRPYHEGIALLFLDLDNFKKLNDNYGHRAGDELLRVIAERLQRASGGGDFVSRVGGDEFVVILTGLVSLEQARESADRILESVSSRLTLEGHDMRPVVSAGLAFSHHREIDAQTLVEDADQTMLKAKRSRHQNGSAGASSVSVSSHRSTRTNDIVSRAISDDRLVLAFQPIVSLDVGKIWAFEALIRYVDPELGPISPPSLVARAKSLGLMNDLTRQVIRKALAAAVEFHRIEPSITRMTVNLELGQISDYELGPFIREAARAHPELSLCIELNERSLRFVTDELRRDAESLQKAGVLIALDDYGSDDSSVGALVRFPMDILKVDKSLINDLDDVRQREVIRSLQGFGNNLNYTVVVEGIETPETAAVLSELGVRSAQGYYFGRPIGFGPTVERLRRTGARATLD